MSARDQYYYEYYYECNVNDQESFLELLTFKISHNCPSCKMKNKFDLVPISFQKIKVANIFLGVGWGELQKKI